MLENTEGVIHRNRQHRVQDEDKQNRNKTQYVLDTTMYNQTKRQKDMSPPTNNWTGGKDETNIVFMRKLSLISKDRTQNVKTHNRTTQKLKRWSLIVVFETTNARINGSIHFVETTKMCIKEQKYLHSTLIRYNSVSKELVFNSAETKHQGDMK